ncbi:MAG TPA: histone deacetylase [Thermoanaerobaculia bacterium]|nr:histone deacetylase [Thermoanaerobaculia bacterium]
MPTGLLYDPRFLDHRAPYGHPEHSGRLSAIWSRFERDGLAARCERVAAREASDEELTAIHTPAHVRAVDATADLDFHAFDPDTYTSRGSAEAARLAAGGLVDLAAAVLEGRLSSGFALVRPPGHHAERDRAMGFCLYNNVAVAARGMQARGLSERVLVVDWDVHHGNGTQHSFWDDPSVLYFSTHQFPFYPGTGAASEAGGGAGRGFTVNLPWPAGMGDAEHLAAFDRLLMPIAERFAPGLVLVSAGFDAAEGDLLGGMRITPAGYAAMTERLTRLAGGRVVLALEGGYNLDAISRSAAACLRVLLGEKAERTDFGEPSRTGDHAIAEAIEVQRPYWRGL